MNGEDAASGRRRCQVHPRIYEPDSTDDVVATFKSGSPFQTIAVGDLVNLTVSGGQLLEATRVEHLVWDANGVANRVPLESGAQCSWRLATAQHPANWSGVVMR